MPSVIDARRERAELEERYRGELDALVRAGDFQGAADKKREMEDAMKSLMTETDALNLPGEQLAPEEYATVEMRYFKEIEELALAEEYQAAADKQQEMQEALSRLESRSASSRKILFGAGSRMRGARSGRCALPRRNQGARGGGRLPGGGRQEA